MNWLKCPLSNWTFFECSYSLSTQEASFYIAFLVMVKMYKSSFTMGWQWFWKLPILTNFYLSSFSANERNSVYLIRKKEKERKKIVKFGLKIENGYLSSKAQITIWYNYFSIFLVCNWRNCPLTKSIFDYLLLYLMVLNKSLLCFTKHEVEINDAEKCRQRQPEQNWKS